MRLTLRTLLAYLDNTLEPEDAAILRAKIEESGFATQLIQRIRSSVTSTELTAPAPELVHPVGEANVISEYLDSTLTPEQIAEIERACLESEPHLAEAAAVHQILTMVLGKPASVSDQLRQRIYLLPDSTKPNQPLSGSFSSVSIPKEDLSGSVADQIPTGESEPTAAGMTVEPVGPSDSGVSDAPTRIRESGTIEDQLGDDIDAAMAGSRPGSHLEVSDVYAGTVRPSRITPWLVSLALAGVLLFVLSQIFAPLLKKQTAQQDPADERISFNPGEATDTAEEIEVSPEESPPLESVGEPAIDIDPLKSAESAGEVPDQVPGEDELMLPPPNLDDDRTHVAEARSDDTPAPNAQAASVESTESPDSGETVNPDPDAAEEMAALKTDVAPAAESGLAKADSLPPTTEVVPPKSQDLKEPAPADQPDADAPSTVGGQALAIATSDNTLLIARVGQDEWKRVRKETGIGDRITLINPPGFRSPMTTSAGQFVLTLIDATQADWIQDPDGGEVPGVNVDFGRALITAKQAAVTTTAILGGYATKITLAEPETVAGIEVRYFRGPGMDPGNPENHVRLARVFSVQGNVQLETEVGSQSLETGQQWLIRDSEVAPVAAMPAIPNWINPPDKKVASIDADAREGLLQLIGEDESLTLALREGVSFRRSEVGALAAQTLLLMGDGSVYFGGDGVLSDPKQRSYWPTHFLALRSLVDYSPESAEALATSITEMDAADGRTLYRLLIGYSQKQLVENGDEDLMDMLDSHSMAVRVLAIENLRAITGTTLYYRAEEENATRRAQATKKWRTRQRKGDIRWNAEN